MVGVEVEFGVGLGIGVVVVVAVGVGNSIGSGLPIYKKVDDIPVGYMNALCLFYVKSYFMKE